LTRSVPDLISFIRRKSGDLERRSGARPDFAPPTRLAIIIAASLVVWAVLIYAIMTVWFR